MTRPVRQCEDLHGAGPAHAPHWRLELRLLKGGKKGLDDHVLLSGAPAPHAEQTATRTVDGGLCPTVYRNIGALLSLLDNLAVNACLRAETVTAVRELFLQAGARIGSSADLPFFQVEVLRDGRASKKMLVIRSKSPADQFFRPLAGVRQSEKNLVLRGVDPEARSQAEVLLREECCASAKSGDEGGYQTGVASAAEQGSGGDGHVLSSSSTKGAAQERSFAVEDGESFGVDGGEEEERNARQEKLFTVFDVPVTLKSPIGGPATTFFMNDITLFAKFKVQGECQCGITLQQFAQFLIELQRNRASQGSSQGDILVLLDDEERTGSTDHDSSSTDQHLPTEEPGFGAMLTDILQKVDPQGYIVVGTSATLNTLSNRTFGHVVCGFFSAPSRSLQFQGAGSPAFHFVNLRTPAPSRSLHDGSVPARENLLSLDVCFALEFMSGLRLQTRPLIPASVGSVFLRDFCRCSPALRAGGQHIPGNTPTSCSENPTDIVELYVVVFKL